MELDIEKEEPPENEKKFSIDISAIQSIDAENQDPELQALGLSVFDQSVYEKGVIEQVGKALTGDADTFLKDETPFTIKLEEEEEDKVEVKDEGSFNVKEEGEIDEEESGYNPDCWEETETKLIPKLEDHSSKESAKSESTQDPVSSIEDYLRKQLKLQEIRKIHGPRFKAKTGSDDHRNKNKSSEQKSKNDKNNKSLMAKTKKENKGKLLAPQKREKKEKLGTKRKSGKASFASNFQPGEENYMYLNTSDSEFHDSGSDYEPSTTRKEKNTNENSELKGREHSAFSVDASGSEYVPSDSDESFDFDSKPKRKDLPTPSRKAKRRKREYLFFERESTSDSDWDSCDEYSPRGKKELDDGDIELYVRRMKEYEKSNPSKEIKRLEGDFIVPLEIWDKLYDYQKKSVKWFWNLNKEMTGGILGDEMGLGKTIQVIAFLAAMHRSCLPDSFTRYEGLGPTLIVCPTTVMHQWVREFHKWYPPLRVIILHESGSFKGNDRKKLISSIHKAPVYGVLITSYTGLVQYKDPILSKEWHYVILDEGHKIRNNKAKVTETAKLLDTPHRIILSGSPLQNNLNELWCLFDFVIPGKLGTAQAFTETFAVPIMQGGYANASKTQVVTAHKCAVILKDTITPYLLRRMKEDVGAHVNLPEKKEQVLFCRLTEEQRELYREFISKVDLTEMIRGRAKIFVALINMRKICNHPDLYSGGPDRNFRIKRGDEPPEEDHFGYWKRAGKMIVIETLLKIWNQQGHRVLLFTQSKKMLLIMEDFVKRKKYKYLKLDGQTSIGSRQPLIDKFNQDASYFVMLLTTKVGGLGVNLTGANRVVIYDPDWNPATDTQARERAWRIGQQRDVTIYRLITAGTIEEKIYHRQIFKQFLSNKILKDPKQRRFFKSNDLLELFSLSETVNHGTTETAAIFAGTGSEIKIPTKCAPPPTKKDEPDMKVSFSQEKIEQMKKLAQMLSKKISDENKKSDVKYIYGPDGEMDMEAAKNLISNNTEPENNNQSTLSSDTTNNKAKNNEASTKKEKRKEKKRKRKESQEKFSSLDGHKVPHLVKKRKLKKDKEKEEREYMSQDDYVLKKLFSKGLETAMKHDYIMGGGPSDYAIVEAEAERVAQSALKSLKESRKQVIPAFSSLVKKVRKNEVDLLSIIRKRNLDLESSSTDENLLSNIITWLQSQGGTATTDQLITEFKYKVGEGKTPLFKALLEKIATFYRGPDKIGYWTIKDEFNSFIASTSSSSHS